MNTIQSIIISLIAATAAFAETPQFEIEARYEGFAPSLFADLNPGAKSTLPDGVLAAPRVTTKAGQTAVIELAREVILPVTLDGKAPVALRGALTLTSTNARGETSVDGRKTINCGVSLVPTCKSSERNVMLRDATSCNINHTQPQ